MICAISNQKGGVSKTTTAINVAAGLAKKKQKVLLIDLDPQGNATMSLGVNKSSVESSVHEFLHGEISFPQGKIAISSHLDLLPANINLAASEPSLAEKEDGVYQLQEKMQPFNSLYDWILLDCPPSLGFLTLNALCYAQKVLLPVQCEYFALEGLADLMSTIEKLQDTTNEHLEIFGIIRTMYDPRTALSKETSNQLLKFFGPLVFETIIPRNIKLAESPSYSKTIFDYDPKSIGAVAYWQLVEELMSRRKAKLR